MAHPIGSLEVKGIVRHVGAYLSTAHILQWTSLVISLQKSPTSSSVEDHRQTQPATHPINSTSSPSKHESPDITATTTCDAVSKELANHRQGTDKELEKREGVRRKPEDNLSGELQDGEMENEELSDNFEYVTFHSYLQGFRDRVEWFHLRFLQLLVEARHAECIWSQEKSWPHWGATTTRREKVGWKSVGVRNMINGIVSSSFDFQTYSFRGSISRYVKHTLQERYGNIFPTESSNSAIVSKLLDL